MRHKHLAGKEALRVSVFMPDMDETAEYRAARYIGTQYDLSLIIRHQGVHHMPGGRERPQVCYQLYMHDEHTPGGFLVADSCQLPEYYLDDAVTDVDDETITLTMNDGYEFVLDLQPILEKYLVDVDINEDGEVILTQHDTERGRWMNGSTYTDNEDGTLTIHAPDGQDYDVDFADRWTFAYSAATRTFTASDNGTPVASFVNGDIVGITTDGTFYTLTIQKPDGSTVTQTWNGTAGGGGGGGGSVVSFVDNGGGSYTITVNGTPTTFQVGDQISFVDNADGTYTVTINGGTPVTFEVGDKVSFTDDGDGDYSLAINGGTPITFNTGVSLVEETSPLNYTAHNADGTTVSWSTAFPPNTIFLQDPVIYLRQVGGVPNPPITEQADLTLANAFNSFSAIVNFLTTCIVQGTITVDARGTFNGPVTFTPAQYKNPAKLIVLGDPADPTLLTFNWSLTAGGSAIFKDGIRVNGGLNMELRNCTFHAQDVNTQARAVSVGGGSELSLNNTIRFTNGATGSPGATCHLFLVSGAALRTATSTANGVPGAIIDIDFDSSAVLDDIAIVDRNSNATLYDVQVDVANAITTNNVFTIMHGSVVTIIREPSTNYFNPVFGGAGGATALSGKAFNIQVGSSIVFTNISGLSLPHSNVQAFLLAGTSTIAVDKLSSVTVGSTTQYGTTGANYT